MTGRRRRRSASRTFDVRQPLLILFLFLFLLASCSGHEHSLPTEPGPAPAPLTTATVSGRVLSLDSRQPVANALISFSDEHDVVTQTTSGADGSYSIAGLTPGFFAIRAGTQIAGSVRLDAGLNARDLFVSDPKCIVQYGTVRNAQSGRPIAGAKVSIYGREVTTGAAGTYTIDFGCAGYVPGSTILIQASADGYVSFSTTTRASFLCTCSFDTSLEPR
jgi:hypothetical protein